MKDIKIARAGPAGLTAAIYASRAGCDVSVFECLSPGGQVMTTPEIENYPGFISINGFELAMKFHEQAEKLNVDFKYENITAIEKTENGFKVKTEQSEYETKSVIIATGAKRRLLDIKGEKEFTGRGVSYCATCDGNFFRGLTATVIGGGNTAVEDALYLANLCEKVYLVHRRNEFRASRVLVDRLSKATNIEIKYSYVPQEICGDSKVDKIILKNLMTDAIEEVATDAVFVAVGTLPNNSIIPEGTELDVGGYIITDSHCMTSVVGVFAAGDVRNTPLKQVITAASDGAVAANYAAEYIGG